MVMNENEHSVITSRIEIIKKDRIRQWDIFKCDELVFWENKFTFPFIFILSQDCDLTQDYNNYTGDSENDDKILESILICPLFNLTEILNGTHIHIEKKTWEILNKKMWIIWWESKKRLIKNQLDRYYYIKSFTEDSLIIPDLVMDFKIFFTIPRDFIYSSFKNNYICSVSEVFRENISRRFANYLSRIWLPSIQEDQILKES